MALRNGYLPADLLREVEPGMYLEAATAAAYLRAKAASGGILKIASPAGAYRSYAVQADMKANPGKYSPDAASSIPIAAPGYSTHGLGTRVDIAVGAGRTWAIVRMSDFGFKREFGSADPGHFQFLSPTFASTGSTPLEDQMTPEQEQKLNAIYDALFKKTPVSAGTTGYKEIPGGTLATLSHLYDRPASSGLSQAQLDAVEAAARAGAEAAIKALVLVPKQ